MDKLVIEGGRSLNGNVTISGAKNSCLPIMAATILTDDKCIIKNVPTLRDVDTMVKILVALGIDTEKQGSLVLREKGPCKNTVAPYDIVSTMRASICVLGPLLAKKKEAKVSFPGGCVIGPRPIDLHLKGLKCLGAEIKVEGGYVYAKTKQLKGAEVYLGGHFGSSVLATANVMMAATLAKGETVIHNAACEPEVEDLANFLIKMGASIQGHSTPTIRIKGVRSMHGAEHTVIPDRIETGTFMLAASITDGDIVLHNTMPGHVMALVYKMKEIGSDVVMTESTIHVKRRKRHVKSCVVTTLPYPGFPTDMQAQVMSLLSIADGISVITEKIYPERFMHISELNRMGAEIMLEGPNAIVKGVRNLSGADVMASDLRASAALVLAGLVARGKTTIHRVYHLDRGYEKIEERLVRLGARIRREKEK